MDRSAMACFLLGALCLAGTVGCGGRAGTAQASGRVLYKDGTVPHGATCLVLFQPAQDSTAEIRKAGMGIIESDGHFEVFTRKEGDGIFLGKYDVVFSVMRDGSDDKSSVIDPKYTSTTTTPYHVTIEGNVDDLEFEIEPLPTKEPKK